MMDDSKHQDAVLAAAEVFERAHQFSVSGLSKAPAARALTVEAVMDVASSILWPESHREQAVEADPDGIRAESAGGDEKNRKMR